MSAQFYGDLAGESQGSADRTGGLVLLHGLSYDRRQWGPLRRELAGLDPDRRVLTLDLPGHGGSPRRASYPLTEVAAAVHDAVIAAGLDAPIVVGHSLGGLLATIYGATYPTRGVVNVDQPLVVGAFAERLRQFEPVLRSPAYLQIWDIMLASMHIDLLPTDAQELVRTASTPRQDLLLGYWQEVLQTPADELDARLMTVLAGIGSRGIPYHHVSGSELDPAYRRWLTAALPAATVSVLPGSGHFPHLAHPAAVAAILAKMST
jgi:pimeloyl-ACP methyl ester carboxylesterase